MENYCAVCTKEFMNDEEFKEHERVCCMSPQINEAVFNGEEEQELFDLNEVLIALFNPPPVDFNINQPDVVNLISDDEDATSDETRLPQVNASEVAENGWSQVVPGDLDSSAIKIMQIEEELARFVTNLVSVFVNFNFSCQVICNHK